MKRKRSLVDLLERSIGRSDDVGPDWPLEVELACERQDLEWQLQVWDEANQRQSVATDRAHPLVSRLHV